MDVAKASPRSSFFSLWSTHLCTITTRQRCFLVLHSPLLSSGTLRFHLYPSRIRVDSPKQILGCKAESADSSSRLSPPAEIAEEPPDGREQVESKKRAHLIQSWTELDLIERSIIENMPYLTGIGLDIGKVRDMVFREPDFAHFCSRGTMEPIVDFLLALGVDCSDVPVILYKSPSLCGLGVRESLVPKMELLEAIGIDKRQWPKVLRRYPPLLTHSLEAMSNIAEYLSEVGLSKENIAKVFTTFPGIVHLSIDAQLKPMMEYFSSMGIDGVGLMTMHMQTFELSLERNVIPKVELLEDMGMDREQWPKLIRYCPTLFCRRNESIRATINCLSRLGISDEEIGRMFGKYPDIIVVNAQKQLMPVVEYLRSLGIDVVPMMRIYPRMFLLNLEKQIKPKTCFFLAEGFTVEEIRAMVVAQPIIYSLSMENDLIPKWEFYRSIDLPRAAFVTYPNFLTASLRARIKPRYGLLKKSGVELQPHEWLILSNRNFLKKLETTMATGYE